MRAISSWSCTPRLNPRNDWAASDPFTDFGVNANGTLNLLEATRRHRPEATFVFTSTIERNVREIDEHNVEAWTATGA